MHESFVPGRYQDAHEQLVNNLTDYLIQGKALYHILKCLLLTTGQNN